MEETYSKSAVRKLTELVYGHGQTEADFLTIEAELFLFKISTLAPGYSNGGVPELPEAEQEAETDDLVASVADVFRTDIAARVVFAALDYQKFSDAFQRYTRGRWDTADTFYAAEGGFNPAAFARALPNYWRPHPHCVARCHMHGQHDTYNLVAGLAAGREDKDVFVSANSMGKWAGNKHREALAASLKWLVDKGWLIEVDAPTPGPDGEGVYRLVSHSTWVSAHGSYSMDPVDCCALQKADAVDFATPPADW